MDAADGYFSSPRLILTRLSGVMRTGPNNPDGGSGSNPSRASADGVDSWMALPNVGLRRQRIELLLDEWNKLGMHRAGCGTGACSGLCGCRQRIASDGLFCCLGGWCRSRRCCWRRRLGALWLCFL